MCFKVLGLNEDKQIYVNLKAVLAHFDFSYYSIGVVDK